MWTKLPAALKWITAVHHGALDDTLHQLKTRSFAENSSVLRQHSERLHKTERQNSAHPPRAGRRFDTLHPKRMLCPYWSLLHSTNHFPEKYNYLRRTQSSKGNVLPRAPQTMNFLEDGRGWGWFASVKVPNIQSLFLTDQPDCLVFTGFS